MRNNHPVAIIEEDITVLESLKQELGCITDNISEYSSSDEFLCEIHFGKFDLMIADINVTGAVSGLEFIRHVRTVDPGLSVLAITAVLDIKEAIDYFRFGVVDFIEKPFNDTEIKTSLNRAMKAQIQAGRNTVRELTKSELAILRHIVDGLSNSEIAHNLSRSVRTIEDHRASLMRKMHADNVVDLVKKAINIGVC